MFRVVTGFFFIFFIGISKKKKNEKGFLWHASRLKHILSLFSWLGYFFGEWGEIDWWLLTWGWHWHVVTSFSFHWLYFGSPNCRLGRLQDSNAVLSHFNEYSEYCFSEVSVEFSWNTRLLRSMKSDLDYIFQKLRYD